MPENSIQNQAFYPPTKVVSISSKTHIKEQPKYNKPHCIIPVEDMTWVLNQAKSIQSLWNQCWQSDPFGSRWVKLTTTLKESSFRLARRALYAAGLFEFKRDTSCSDSRKTESWSVINLHGARRIKEFWNSEPISATDSPIAATDLPIAATDSPIAATDLPIAATDLPISATDLPISATNSRSICSESIANTRVPESLSNSSLSSQELLNEVPEEVTPTNELLEKVRSRGTKIADELATVMERCLKRARGEEPEQFFRELFISRYKWKIDDERFQKLIQLTKECRLSFFEKFKYVYQNDGMSAPRTFDKAIDFVIKNASSINETVNLQLLAFNYQPTC
ncbi:MAG: hypothetical protein V7K35_13385 [Nostoc sp.]|uniref:hypothetical protein n=1 Tax=Nostoc sp. TaxID=1180 RepID=UPI002FFA7B62